MKKCYLIPDTQAEDLLLSQMLCDSLVGGLEDTVDDPIYY